jgi:PST family polysaccharide transporter/lipopolysaccharide exporter
MSGIMFGAASLGIYQMASRFALLPTSQIGELSFNAIFPAYSLIQNDTEKLKLTFVKVLQVSSVVLFPLTAVMIVAVAPIVPFVLGAKWTEVVNLMPGIAVGGMIQAVLRTGAPLFMAKGRPKLLFAIDLISALGVLICIFPFSNYFGLVGLSWAYAAGLALAIPLWWSLVQSQSGLTTGDMIGAFLPTLMASIILGICIEIPAKLLLTDHVVWVFLCGLTVFTFFGAILFWRFIVILERLVPGYRPLSSTLTLIKGYFNTSKAPVTEMY